MYCLLYCCCSITKSCLTLCNPMNCSMPGFPALQYLPELAQTHVHWVSDAIKPSHPLSPPSPLALSLSQHQVLFQSGSSLHQVAKVMELQHRSFQWIFRVDFLYDWLVWSPCCPRESQESSSTTVPKCQFKSTVGLGRTNFHINQCTTEQKGRLILSLLRFNSIRSPVPGWHSAAYVKQQK